MKKIRSKKDKSEKFRRHSSDHIDCKNSDFQNITSIENSIYTYNSSDVTVIESFELPLHLPFEYGGLIKYKFSTAYGNISFGAIFEDTKDSTFEIMIDINEVNSDREVIEGEITLEKSGAVYFMFY